MTTTPTLDQMLAEAVEALQAIALARSTANATGSAACRITRRTTSHCARCASSSNAACASTTSTAAMHVARAVLARIMLGASAPGRRQREPLLSRRTQYKPHPQNGCGFVRLCPCEHPFFGRN